MRERERKMVVLQGHIIYQGVIQFLASEKTKYSAIHKKTLNRQQRIQNESSSIIIIKLMLTDDSPIKKKNSDLVIFKLLISCLYNLPSKRYKMIK